MTDFELIRKCADAMGIKNLGETDIYEMNYNPLTHDAQAMALIKKFKPDIAQTDDKKFVVWFEHVHDQYHESADLNRAICLCVANMQAAK